MTRYTFEQVALRASKRVACAAGCGRKVTRQRTFNWRLLPEWCPKDRAA